MKRKINVTVVAFLFLLTIVLNLSGCNKNTDDGKIKIVTTAFPQYDLARNIGGDEVEVIKLLPWGSEAHTYDPSIRDISLLADADLFIYNGEIAERWASELASVSREEDCRVVDLSVGVKLLGASEEGHTHDGDDDHDHGHDEDYDVHIWTSPENVVAMSAVVCASLCEVAPEKADLFVSNAEEYTKKLTDLSEGFEELSREYDGRTLYFGGRFAFLYLFDRYGFNYKSPYQGCGEESEPGIRTVTEMCEEMKKNGARYIFYEEMSDGKIAKSIAEETGAEPVMLHSCHNLTLDEMESGEDYISVMTRNLEVLRVAAGVE